jgi:hypothetical protein
VEASERDPVVPRALLEQRRRDQEAAEDEREVDAEVAAVEAEEVEADDESDRVARSPSSAGW